VGKPSRSEVHTVRSNAAQKPRSVPSKKSVHARKLEESEYVLCEKRFEGRVPKTTYSLTTQGKRALESYLNHMESLIKTARDG